MKFTLIFAENFVFYLFKEVKLILVFIIIIKVFLFIPFVYYDAVSCYKYTGLKYNGQTINKFSFCTVVHSFINSVYFHFLHTSIAGL